MNRRNTLYMQKAAIAAAVYLVLRYLLPLVFPFFFAWLTVAALNRFRHRISMRLVPLSAGVLSILFLAVLLFLLLSGYLLYPPSGNFFRCGRISFYVCHFCLTGFLPPCWDSSPA